MRLAQDTRRRQAQPGTGGGATAPAAADKATTQAIAATRLAAASDAKSAKTALASGDLTEINAQLADKIDVINQRLSAIETQLP